jgi:hypothetical protein
MHMTIELNKVTRLSQLLAIFLFLVVFALGFFLGLVYKSAYTIGYQEQLQRQAHMPDAPVATTTAP